jgi:hypothetical protein
MQKFIADAKSGKKVKGLFTHPNTPIKCGGAPKKIMYLTDARLREAGARENAELTFYPNGSKMFGVKEYHDAITHKLINAPIKLLTHQLGFFKEGLLDIVTKNTFTKFIQKSCAVS